MAELADPRHPAGRARAAAHVSDTGSADMQGGLRTRITYGQRSDYRAEVSVTIG